MVKFRTFPSSPLRVLLVTWCLLLCWTTVVVEARKKKEAAQSAESDNDDDDIPGVPYLIETIGKEIYSAVNRPKYKFYIYLTVGRLPDEESTIVLLNMICNLLYGICILGGFLILPRGYMLIGTAVTLFIGPALVLILLGTLALVLVAFALHPISSVFFVWVFFFLNSQIAQVLGRKLGLDHDGDGDVDWLDVLSWASNTKVGKWMGLPKLHEMLNESAMDPFQGIHRRLDEIENTTRLNSMRIKGD